MSDDKAAPPPPAPPPAALSPAAPAPLDKGPKAPMAIIHGQATTSSWLEKDLAARAHNRKVAQEEADRDAAAHQDAQGSHDTVSLSHTADMGRPTTNPVCVIEVVLAGGRKHQYIQCDLSVVEWNGEMGIQLNMICPSCVARGIPQGDAQIRIHEKHKRMHLDMSTKGEIWVDPDTGAAHLLAGTIDVDETCGCPMPGCGFKFKIAAGGKGRNGVSVLRKE